ncbi:unnamed protein product [Ectocarpus sp. CCAP 1310/34]|nr:unnamed protein product [Ectocarpus sp. CCAP 1310/34]
MSPADMLRLTLPLLLSVPAAGVASLPSSSRGLVPHRSSPLYLSTSAAAKIMFDRSSCSGGGISLPSARPGWPRRGQRLQRGSKNIKHQLSSGWGVGVVCGAGGDSNAGDDESSGRRDDDSERGKNDGANSAPKDEGSLMAEKQGANNSAGDGDDSLQTSAFSVSALEDELQARAAQKAATTQRDGARSGGGTTADEGEDAWLPRFFPPPLPTQDDEEGDAIQPLIELPLDGILLQLFPALLIGVLGLFLTVVIQVEAGRFDGMVGEDGGVVVVTDLRDTRTQEQP